MHMRMCVRLFMCVTMCMIRMRMHMPAPMPMPRLTMTHCAHAHVCAHAHALAQHAAERLVVDLHCEPTSLLTQPTACFHVATALAIMAAYVHALALEEKV